MIRIDTSACRDVLAFDTPAQQALDRIRECARDSLTQRRITIDRADYIAGVLDGPASSTRLDGQPYQTLSYTAGKPAGEEVFYDDGEVFKRITHVKGRSDTIYVDPHRQDSLSKLGQGDNRIVEHMPAFTAPECPEIGITEATEAEVSAYQKCATQAMLEYIYGNIKYPKSSRLLGVEGLSVVTFVIERDGSITNARTASFVSGPIDAEALRVVRSMPLWHPGYQAGEPVRVQFNLPVNFRLE